jgi:hypothetical protein
MEETKRRFPPLIFMSSQIDIKTEVKSSVEKTSRLRQPNLVNPHFSPKLTVRSALDLVVSLTQTLDTGSHVWVRDTIVSGNKLSVKVGIV